MDTVLQIVQESFAFVDTAQTATKIEYGIWFGYCVHGNTSYGDVMKKYFHGSNRSGPYFEGWYFKCQTQDGQSLALIPAFHISENGEQSASIQVATDKQAWYLDYPASAFTASQDSLRIVIGENCFLDAGLHLNVE